jgi:hypothetical protein
VSALPASFIDVIPWATAHRGSYYFLPGAVGAPLGFLERTVMSDEDFREIPSPLTSRSADQPHVKPPKPVVVPIPGLDQDRVLTIAFEELRKLPVPRQNLLLSHLMALLQLHPADCAIVVLHVQPYLSDAQIALLCDRSERQLRRYAEYQRFKEGLAESLQRRQQRWYTSVEMGD